MSDVSQGPGWWQASDGKWYPPQPVATLPPPKKKFYKRVWFWLLMIVLLIVVIIIAVVASVAHTINDLATAKHTVVYTVTGNGTADITYGTDTDGNAGTGQDTNVTLPWTKTITGSGLLAIFDVNATVSSGSTVTCTLTIDGKQVSTNTGHGQFASADCTGTGS